MDEARKAWSDVIEDHPGTVYSYEAMIGLAQDEVAHGHYEAGIARLERPPLDDVRAIWRAHAPMGSGSQPPSRYEKQMAGEVDRMICSLLGAWCGELGRYSDVARWMWESQRAAREPSDDFSPLPVPFEEDYAANFYLELDRNRVFMASSRFTQMLNGFTIAGGGAARQPILSDLATRRELWFEGTLDDGGMSQLGELPQLKSLSCGREKLTNKGLATLADLGNLEQLSLSSTSIDDNGLRYLAGLTNLKTLTLAHCHVTDRGLVHLKDLTQLTSLGLPGTQVTARGLVHLQRLTNLEEINLPQGSVTGGTLAYPAALWPSAGR